MTRPIGLGPVAAGLILAASLIAGGCDEPPSNELPNDRWWSDPQSAAPVRPGPAATAGPFDPSAIRQRYCSIILLNPDKVQEYVNLHSDVPRDVQEALRAHSIRNYSIYLKGSTGTDFDSQFYVVRYYEYVGSNHEVDMTILARNSDYQQWQHACEACQVSMLPLSSGRWWAPMEELFHKD